uniref:Retrovirus-related Pol polyprotein from transposon TNT 1-94 n=1 Tax=Tanacetum cinerariifolium TaxID=118510 RepID=A0A699K5Y2_TANCI|nr:retrovirus-related Pol polyprotein from transposon TNT 1-94 [Tanacetum cinerariifolium]
MSSVRTPQQNGVVERRNRTLVEAARTMLIFSRAPLFLWAEAIAAAKPNISFLHVFGALCYPKNDLEDIGKLGAKGDIGFFIGYFADSCAYRIYNRRTKKIMETINVRNKREKDKIGTKPDQIKKKEEAWQSPEKSRVVSVDRARKIEENVKRMVENAGTVKKLLKFKERKKRQGPDLQFH